MKHKGIYSSTFSIDRFFAHAPDLVFAAWSTKEFKRQWFVGPNDWTELERVFEFRIGGRETAKGRFPNGKVSFFDARFHEIVPDALIVYAYDMSVDDVKLSVSLASIEFLREGAGTLLRVTEQGVFFGDERDAPQRKEGTALLLGQLDASLSRRAPA